MAKDKDTKVGAKGIGLATEHRLPDAFKARTDADAGTVEIRRQNGRPLDVAINSFASVANVLAIFSADGEPSLKPEHTIRIVDDFTGREVTITANTFVDVAAAFQVFLVEKGRYLPSATPVEQTKESKAVVAEAPPAARISDEAAKPRATAAGPGKAQSKSGKKAAPAARKSRQPEKSEPSAAAAPTAETNEKKPVTIQRIGDKLDVPEWAKDLPWEYVDDSNSFRMQARTLALPKERAKTVEGISDGSTQFPAFGYEVTKGGKHVGWVIVEDLKSWVVTGFGTIAPSKHANLAAAAIRIRVTNLPQVA